MFVNSFTLLAAGGPFYEAYAASDFLGKLIFLSIIATSICSWAIFLYKFFLIRRARVNSLVFFQAFIKKKNNPLLLENEGNFKQREENPFYELYSSLKRMTIELLTKNRKFGSGNEETSYLFPSDVDCLSGHLNSGIDLQIKQLDSYVFVMSTIVGLAPLLGLLGTVWGILTAFSSLQSNLSANTNQMVLGGIALALTTTVMGLLSAMPALIGYNYLKHAIRNFEIEMEGAANDMLSSVEIHYRKVDR